MSNIVVSGYYGSKNAGDEAMLAAMIEVLADLDHRAVRDVQRAQQLQRARARRGVRHPGEHRQQRDVVGDVEERNQIRCLEYKAYPVPPQSTKIFDLPAVIINDVISEYHFSGGRLDHCSQTFKERSFARSRRTYQSNDLARRNVHVDGL